MSKLRQGQFKEAVYVRHVWSARPVAGTKVEDLADPTFWANIAEQLKPNDRIEVIPEDGAFFAELIVRSCNRLSATTFPLRIIDLSPAGAVAEDPEFDVVFRGPRKFCIVRRADKVPVIEDIDTKELAFRELSDYLKVHKQRVA